MEDIGIELPVITERGCMFAPKVFHTQSWHCRLTTIAIYHAGDGSPMKTCRETGRVGKGTDTGTGTMTGARKKGIWTEKGILKSTDLKCLQDEKGGSEIPLCLLL